MRIIAFLFLSMVVTAASPILKAKRIVFLGDSVTFSGIHIADLEAYLDLARPDPERVILNLGLPSETVSGLSEDGHADGRFPRPDLAERLDRVLEGTKPDLIVAAYGINCGIYQNFDEGRFEAYKKGIRALSANARKRKISLMFLTPWPFDTQMNKEIFNNYNDVMAKYAQFVFSHGESVFDIHSIMTAELAKRRKADPQFSFTRDGIHANKHGDEFAATLMLRMIGVKGSAKEAFAQFPNANEVRKLSSQRMQLLRNAWLTKTGHKRPGIKEGMPLAEAEKKAAELSKQIAGLTK